MKFRQSSDIINSKVPLVDNRIDNPYENQLVFYIYCKIEKKKRIISNDLWMTPDILNGEKLHYSSI